MTSSHPKTPKAGSQRTSALATVLTGGLLKASNAPVTRIHKVKELHPGSIPRRGLCYLSLPDSQQTVSQIRRAAVLPKVIAGGSGEKGGIGAAGTTHPSGAG
jgi:hypothetical protein